MKFDVKKKDILHVAKLYLDGFMTTAGDREIAELALGCDDCALVDKAAKEALDFFNLPVGDLSEVKTELHLIRGDIASSAGWDEERAITALSMH